MTENSHNRFGGEPPSAQRAAVEPFTETLERHGLSLVRGEVRALQINTGYLCNLSCRHCHLEAGPGRREVMSRETMSAVIAFAERFPFPAIDITGGAPEMVPGLVFLIAGLAPLAPKLLMRTNLTALASPDREELLTLCAARRVVLMASFPSANPSQADAQRGAGFAESGAAMIGKLNGLGYGMEGSGLELNLVSNPVGAFPAAPQAQAEAKFRRDLKRKWGIAFNNLYTLGNVPLGRFRKWLVESGNFEPYLRRLADGFNPCAVAGLMCRTQISVSWDGHLYDCDFNMAVDRHLGERKTHVSEIVRLPSPGTKVAVGDYCYACTFGPGFT
jgi:radical SAM/Cys-rich protein